MFAAEKTLTNLSEVRLLLVEFLNDDPFHQHRIEDYPFLQGRVKTAGGQCRWVAVAAGKDVRPNEPFLVEPDARIEGLISEALGSFRPTHVVLNERIPDAALARLREWAPEAHIVHPPDTLSRRGEEGIVPDFYRERLDPEHPTAQHFVSISLEPHCIYRASIRSNPFFEGVAFPDDAVVRGCTFCLREDEGTGLMPRGKAVESVLHQVRRYSETAHPLDLRNRYLFLVAPALSAMGPLLEGILDLKLPPSGLFFTCRVDELLAMADALKRLIPELARAGHTFHLWQMGGENFSATENLRFNKGVTPDQVEEAIRLADELSRTWPGAFVWREYGLAMILFTPWTTVTDLRDNVDALKRVLLKAPLENRLQLRRRSALASLARKDGLVLEGDRPVDPFFTSSITHWGEEEIPWRFFHPEMGVLFAVGAHLFPSKTRPWDPELANAVEELRREGSPLLEDPTATLERMLDVLEENAFATPLELLEATIRSFVVAGASNRSGGVGPEDRLVRLVRGLMTPGGSPRSLEGWTLSSEVQPCDDGAQFVLAQGDERLRLILALRNPRKPAMAVTTHFALSHSPETPVTTPQARRLVSALLDDLRRVEERLNRKSRHSKER